MSMSDKLFLAKIEVLRSDYMERSRTEHYTRLVWAKDAEDAERKIAEHFNFDEPYSHSEEVQNVELSEAIM